MPDLVESIKKAALQAVDNSKPCGLMFGTVISDSPLKIQVGQKLILTDDQLVLTRNVTDFEVEVSTNWGTSSSLGSHTHSVNLSAAVSVSSGGDPSHSHGASGSVNGSTGGASLGHSHSISGRNTVTVHNALSSGESVLLIQQSGGQKFIVIDRVVT